MRCKQKPDGAHGAPYPLPHGVDPSPADTPFPPALQQWKVQAKPDGPCVPPGHEHPIALQLSLITDLLIIQETRLVRPLVGAGLVVDDPAHTVRVYEAAVDHHVYDPAFVQPRQAVLAPGFLMIRVQDPASPGVLQGLGHGPQHPFQLIVREPDHPITKGLPERFMHSKDELYIKLRGPAKNFTVLATAYADPAKKGTGYHEPVLMTIAYGNGRVFHTTMGHGGGQCRSVAFIATYQRGAEWAATGKVTQKAPGDFPGPDEPSVRE